MRGRWLGAIIGLAFFPYVCFGANYQYLGETPDGKYTMSVDSSSIAVDKTYPAGISLTKSYQAENRGEKVGVNYLSFTIKVVAHANPTRYMLMNIQAYETGYFEVVKTQGIDARTEKLEFTNKGDGKVYSLSEDPILKKLTDNLWAQQRQREAEEKKRNEIAAKKRYQEAQLTSRIHSSLGVMFNTLLCYGIYAGFAYWRKNGQRET